MSLADRTHRTPRGLRRRSAGALLVLGSVLLAACGGEGSGEVTMEVPRGASFQTVVDTLEARDLVRHPLPFRIWARLRGADRSVRAGRYTFPADAGWNRILDDLVAGRVQTEALTIPEGFTRRQIAPRLAKITGLPEDSVRRVLGSEERARSLGVPGPTLEGYLYPETYRFAPGAPLDAVLRTLVRAYRDYWTPGRQERLDSLEMSERALVTLASIVQAEARLTAEMDTIAAVYHNRLERGYLLQADPTVLYALGGPRKRLLYPAMDSVADDPYNTYTHPGLPPGPIGSPGRAALDASLWPAQTDYLYFVARPDGTHIFSHTLVEHNRAVARARRLRDDAEREDP